MNPFLQSDQDEADTVGGEVTSQESQEKPKPVPAARPPPPQVKPERPAVPNLPVSRQQPQAEGTEVSSVSKEYYQNSWTMNSEIRVTVDFGTRSVMI